ncbi:MAG: DNA sulfur modification protein DndD, partial [Idiomarina sp.]|uniref:DNA sulfur modification protein DndD n=1 Tax=Idiomarina sp. TaxID=1874361 RepID=UPI000C3718E5
EIGNFLPLSLAMGELEQLRNRLEDESESKKKASFLSELNSVLPDIKESFTKHTEPALSDALSKSILDTVSSLDSYSNISDIVVDLSDTDFSRFKEHINLAKKSHSTIRTQVNRLKTVTEKLDNLSVNLDRAPQESELIELHEKLRKINKELSSARRNYLAALRDAKFSISKALDLSRQLEKQYASKSSESALRKSIERAKKARSALSSLKQKILTSRVKELEERFVESFRKLNRKDSKNIGVKIDSSSFNVKLIDDFGNELSRRAISAGEKQIFALAILEALGALSGKDLPLVVDTPLGRLDSSHRDRIVKNYFPHASKQVIILSTDTEIDEPLYNLLEPAIDSSYKLLFDESTSSTCIEPGYFWQVKELFYAAQ